MKRMSDLATSPACAEPVSITTTPSSVITQLTLLFGTLRPGTATLSRLKTLLSTYEMEKYFLSTLWQRFVPFRALLNAQTRPSSDSAASCHLRAAAFAATTPVSVSL